MRATLLDAVAGLLTRTYRIESGLGDLGRFVIGDRGFARIYRSRPVVTHVDSAGAGRARMMVRQTERGLRASIFFPDALIERLEADPPQHGIHEGNVDAFATFVEEIDHLLLLAERSRLGRPVSLFEMELHANVSKYLVLSRFASRAGRLAPAARLWLRERLLDLDPQAFDDADARVRQRYADAARWAARLIAALPRMQPADRLRGLRRFHDAASSEKLRLIQQLAA